MKDAFQSLQLQHSKKNQKPETSKRCKFFCNRDLNGLVRSCTLVAGKKYVANPNAIHAGPVWRPSRRPSLLYTSTQSELKKWHHPSIQFPSSLLAVKLFSDPFMLTTSEDQMFDILYILYIILNWLIPDAQHPVTRSKDTAVQSRFFHKNLQFRCTTL